MLVQLSPNPNPYNGDITAHDEVYQTDNYTNNGSITLMGGMTNNAIFNNTYDGFESNLIIHTGDFENVGELHNQGSISIYGPKATQAFSNIIDGLLTNNTVDSQEGKVGGTIDIYNDGALVNYGSIVNNGVITVHSGAIENTTSGSISGNGSINVPAGGTLTNEGTISPGNSTGGFLINGTLNHNDAGSKEIELSGTDDADRDLIKTDYDFIDITGDLILDGGALEVSLIDGFELGLDQEFIIAKVDGELTGTYEGLEEGAIVGHFDSIYGQIGMNLFITYEAGDGNDIALYTEDNLFGFQYF